MSWTKTNQLDQLRALLAMPASLRLVLVGPPSRPRFSPTYLPPLNLRHYASKKHRNRKGNSAEIAAFSLPEYKPTGTAAVAHVSHEELHQRTILSLYRHLPLETGLKMFFAGNDARLYDATVDFYLLKKNTRIPEVAILGRSNVGKSAFINGVAHSFRRTLAHTGQKAGRTKAMMLYGFGPQPRTQDLVSHAAELSGGENLPQYSMYLVDMPGYGAGSLAVWGDNIKLYLEKRTNLKGVIVLIDGVVGPKPTDEQLLRMLCSLERKTAIVLTKVDKALEWVNRLRLTCRKLNQIIGNIQKEQVEKNWIVDRDVYVTACDARDKDLLHSTLTTARIVVARQAGLIEDNLPETDRNKKWSGDVVSFEDLQYKTEEDVPTTAPKANVENTSPEIQPPPKKNDGPKRSFSFAELERASAMERRARSKVGRRFLHTSSDVRSILGPQSRTFVRKYHSSATKDRSRPAPSPKNDENVFEAFINDLRHSNTKANRARNVRDQFDRKPPSPVRSSVVDLALKAWSQRLERRFQDETKRAQKVKVKRLTLGKKESNEIQVNRKERTRTQTQAKAAQIDDDEWPTMPSPTRKNKTSAGLDGVISPDAFKAMVTSPDLPPEEPASTGSRKKKGKHARRKESKAKKKAKVAESKPVDPFEAKFGDAFSSSKQKITARSSF